MVKTWTVDKQRASVRKAVAKLRSNRKAKGCCPYCGIQKSLGAVDVLHVKAESPRRMKPAVSDPPVSSSVSAVVDVRSMKRCMGCHLLKSVEELDIRGRCRQCH